MKVKEIAEAIAKLPPDQLARFRRWFNTFEAGRADHAKELDSTATKLGRLGLWPCHFLVGFRGSGINFDNSPMISSAALDSSPAPTSLIV